MATAVATVRVVTAHNVTLLLLFIIIVVRPGGPRAPRAISLTSFHLADTDRRLATGRHLGGTSKLLLLLL